MEKNNTKETIVKPKKRSQKIIREELWDALWLEISQKDLNLMRLMKNKGIDLQTMKQMLTTPHWQKEATDLKFKKSTVKVWIIWDTHLWAKACDIKSLNDFYEECVKAWVDTMLHWWDLVDWHWVFKWQVFEQAKHWFDEQMEEVVSNYPKVDEFNTYFINGNHDESFLKSANVDTWPIIEKERPDLKYLGFYNWKIRINNTLVELQHWGWWGSYAKSYKIQKYIENTDPDDMPEIYVLGHYHQALYMMYRWAHSFLPWSFQWENLLTKRFWLWNIIGWWILEITKEWNKTICKPNFISFK